MTRGSSRPPRRAPAARRRPPDADGPDGGDAAAEDARAADLRLRPALVGRLRDGVGARRPRRRLGGLRASRLSDLDRDRRAARDRRPLVPADRSRLRDERRRVRRRAREPRHAAEPRRRRRAAHRLRAHRRGLDLGRDLRDHVVRAVARRATRSRSRSRALLADRARQPARRARVGARSSRCRPISSSPRSACSSSPGSSSSPRATRTARSSPHALPVGTGAITLFVLLRAFSSGSTALTGVEAIANGVNAFRHPQGKNAAQTLAMLGAIAISLFLGVSYLAVHVHARPSSTDSVVSQIARAVFPAGSVGGFMYYVVQGLTLLVLILAANTSFQGFPRLSALLARDRFAPRQFTNLGDRLVFSNGMVVLADRRRAPALDLRREHEQPHPPLRDRRVHRVHAVAGGDGALLVHAPRHALAGEGARERRRRDRDGSRHARRRRTRSSARAPGSSPSRSRCSCVGDARDPTALRRLARRSRAGAAAVVAAPPAHNTTLLVVERSTRRATRRSGSRARSRATRLRAVHVPRRAEPTPASGRAGSSSPGAAARSRSTRRSA